MGNAASSTKTQKSLGVPLTAEAVQGPRTPSPLQALPLLLVASIFNQHPGTQKEEQRWEACFTAHLAMSLAPLCDGAADTPSQDGKQTAAFRSPSSSSKPKLMTLLILRALEKPPRAGRGGSSLIASLPSDRQGFCG